MDYVDSNPNAKKSNQRLSEVKKVLFIILLLNLAVAAAKFLYGLITDTQSMKADGIHSLFDSAGNVVGLIGLFIASRPADKDHPYGHAKFETYASAIIGVFLVIAAYNIGSNAISRLLTGGGSPQVTVISFVVMIGTLVINIIVTTYEHRKGKELHSEILQADAMHTLSDVLVSLSVIVGLVFIKLGFPIADPIVSLIVAMAIIYTAFGVFKQANETLSDRARIDPAKIIEVLSPDERIKEIHHIRTRGTEGEVYLDMHILLDPQTRLIDAHRIVHDAEDKLHEKFPQIVDITSHLEPDIPSERL